jgi:hypothetical protein
MPKRLVHGKAQFQTEWQETVTGAYFVTTEFDSIVKDHLQ